MCISKSRDTARGAWVRPGTWETQNRLVSPKTLLVHKQHDLQGSVQNTVNVWSRRLLNLNI